MNIIPLQPLGLVFTTLLVSQSLYMDPQLLSSVLALVQLRPIGQSYQCCQHPQTQLKPHWQDPINGAGKSQLH